MRSVQNICFFHQGIDSLSSYGDKLTRDLRENIDQLQNQILQFCSHIAEPAQIVAVGLFDNCLSEASSTKMTVQVVAVIREFQPKLMSYVKTLNDRTLILVAVDQWVFEQDVERGLLGEASVNMLVFSYLPIRGKNYLEKLEITLKRRLILESLENIVIGFPELYDQLRIKPEYFMYEVMLNRIRLFPPLAFCTPSLFQESEVSNNKNLAGYIMALEQLSKEKRITFSGTWVMLCNTGSKGSFPRARLSGITKNAQRSIFTSLFEMFPALLNFLSQNTVELSEFQPPWQKNSGGRMHPLVEPQKFVFVPTAKGFVSLADRLNMEKYARKILLNGKNGATNIKPMGGVLNDVFFIEAISKEEGNKQILVKRFKDWSGFKWFPLAIWSFGARNFAVLGSSRLERECAISEILRKEGISIPKVLHVSHGERLVFMEFVEGENLSNIFKKMTMSTRDQIEDKLSLICRVGKILARVHALNIALGDTKPENVIIGADGTIYLIDFEQATRNGDKSWDIAEFLYYSGHYLPPLNSNGKAEIIAKAFVSGYLKGGGNLRTVKKAGAPKYRRVFSIFTMPSIIATMSNVCRKSEDVQ
jgi:tRNA A-37 threonylcarbamoyl transferase component Bud32